MNVSLPDELRSFVDQEVDEGGYGSTSEYVRALVRRDQDRHQLRTLLSDGASSGPFDYDDSRQTTFRAPSSTYAPEQARTSRPDSSTLLKPPLCTSVEIHTEVPCGSHTSSTSPQLGALALPRFPYLIFYLERKDGIDIWRILLTRRDLPTKLADSDDQ
jgi:putative addiction module CopG family antidote